MTSPSEKPKYKPIKLTKAERERGWVLYACPDHGGIAAGPPGASVKCDCGKKAPAK